MLTLGYIGGNIELTVRDSYRKGVKKLNNKIAEYRLSKGITQQELADMAEVSRTHLGLVERGISDPSVDLMKRIAKALNCKLSDIFFD